MQKLSSEALDFYDDPSGAVLKSRFPRPELVPPFIKEGTLLDENARSQLPDDLFALVMHEDGKKLKKFAMNDKANTALSVIYFLDNAASKMPPKLAKIAAQRLVTGCFWYDMEPPNSLVKAGEGEFPDYVDPGVDTEKVASVGPMVESKIMALPSQNKYPLDSYKDTMKAAEYFDKYASRMDPPARREYATNLVKRAEELAIPVGEKVHLYSSNKYASKGHIAHQIRLRMEKAADDKSKAKYGLLFNKMASVTPGVAGEALAILDTETGLSRHWGGTLLDPFESVLQEKSAQEDHYMFTDPIAPITDTDLHNMVDSAQKLIEKALGKDFYKDFRDDPVGVFKSLPLPEKRVLIRIKATENM